MRGVQQVRLPAEIAAPDFIASYLASSGWTVSRADNTRMLWTFPDLDRGRPLSLMLPLDSTFADYEDRLSEVVARLCALNSWDVDELALNIVQARSDLLLIRADQATYNDSIPLRQAEQMITGSSDLLLSAARATLSRRAHFHGKSPDLAREFMDQDVRMGHTRRGSFILTIVTSLTDRGPSSHSTEPTATTNEAGGPEARVAVRERSDDEIRAEAFRAAEATSSISTESPVDDGGSDPTDSPRIPPFQRRVMSTLATGLSAAQGLALARSGAGSIDDAIQAGMSSNMLDSIDKMSSFEGLRALDLRFQWSRIEPIPRDQPTEIVIPHSVFSTLKSTSETLKERPEIARRETIVGRIARVDIDDEDHKSGEGIFRIKGITGKADQAANMLLSGKGYSLAYRALRSRQLITATGHLEKVKGVWWLTGDVVVEAGPGGTA